MRVPKALIRALLYCAARETQIYWLLAFYSAVFFGAYAAARWL